MPEFIPWHLYLACVIAGVEIVAIASILYRPLDRLHMRMKQRRWVVTMRRAIPGGQRVDRVVEWIRAERLTAFRVAAVVAGVLIIAFGVAGLVIR